MLFFFGEFRKSLDSLNYRHEEQKVRRLWFWSNRENASKKDFNTLFPTIAKIRSPFSWKCRLRTYDTTWTTKVDRYKTAQKVRIHRLKLLTRILHISTRQARATLMTLDHTLSSKKKTLGRFLPFLQLAWTCRKKCFEEASVQLRMWTSPSLLISLWLFVVKMHRLVLFPKNVQETN